MVSFDGCPTAMKCEALALANAAQWVDSLNLPNVLFEMGSLNVVAAVQSVEEDSSELGMIIETIKRVFRPSWQIQFVRRRDRDSKKYDTWLGQWRNQGSWEVIGFSIFEEKLYVKI
ncbi:hypothetical protein LINPERPRIM_LOCUS16398, partial [Linum perenne]